MPGPPANRNSGSGDLRRLIAGTRATCSATFRPPGAAGFSGTSRVPHSALSTVKCAASSSEHGESDSDAAFDAESEASAGPVVSADSAIPASAAPKRACLKRNRRRGDGVVFKRGGRLMHAHPGQVRPISLSRRAGLGLPAGHRPRNLVAAFGESDDRPYNTQPSTQPPD